MQVSAGTNRRRINIPILAATLGLLLTVFGTHQAWAQTSAGLRVYGPGGPAPAMKEAAKAFEQKTGTPVVVTAGPTPEWFEPES